MLSSRIKHGPRLILPETESTKVEIVNRGVCGT